MAAERFGSLIPWLIVPAIAAVVATDLRRWLYRRSTKETAFARAMVEPQTEGASFLT